MGWDCSMKSSCHRKDSSISEDSGDFADGDEAGGQQKRGDGNCRVQRLVDDSGLCGMSLTSS